MFPDIHWRYRDKTAMTVAMRALSVFKPDIILIGGDLLDCDVFARHPATMIESAAGTWVENELQPAKEWLQDLHDRHEKIVYLEGNHEHWIERMCANGGKALENIFPLINPRSFLTGHLARCEYVPYANRWGRKGGSYRLHHRLFAVHGWTACRHSAGRHLDLARSHSLVYFHTHRCQMERTHDPFTGHVLEAFSPGCLSKLQPLYAHGGTPTAWSHGFAVAYLGKDSYTAYCVGIDRGEAVLPDGTAVRVK